MSPLHHETAVVVDAPRNEVFSYLDDFHKLSAHMEKPSGMMMGARMVLETDAQGGRAVGSKVRMSGKMMGMKLALEEVVTERVAPLRKAWKTVNTRLVVIGDYRLGFDLTPVDGKTRVRIFIDYELPAGAARLLGKLFGGLYARWCTSKMAGDAARHFAAT